MRASIGFSADEYQVILRNDLTSFIERSFMELNPQATFMASPYIELLASTLEKCRTGKTKRQIINLPPRTLKSHAASVAFPAWLLGHDASKQVICVLPFHVLDGLTGSLNFGVHSTSWKTRIGP